MGQSINIINKVYLIVINVFTYFINLLVKKYYFLFQDGVGGGLMFRAFLIENMSYFIAPDTGKRYDIFGNGGAKKVAESLGFDCLGQIPLQINVREGGDSGKPIVEVEPESEISQIFLEMSRKIAAKLSIQAAQEI